MRFVPQSADPFENTGRCVELGVALQVLPSEVAASAINMAVERCEALVRCQTLSPRSDSNVRAIDAGW
jgi:hypothetical protein